MVKLEAQTDGDIHKDKSPQKREKKPLWATIAFVEEISLVEETTPEGATEYKADTPHGNQQVWPTSVNGYPAIYYLRGEVPIVAVFQADPPCLKSKLVPEREREIKSWS